ncbi:RHS repeat domain-containing protein, partial [Elizabethkingia anophelis]|uniref:RHS repeat domain-containing protein n=1 Tax=Elizabethkingia anophelis TaxID=1117645 RepID=UPI0038917E7E
KMNDPRNLRNKLFGFELKYINPSGTSKKYNGNIAETDWATQSDGTLRRYSYQYDGVNRLKEGNYWDNAGAISGSYAERLNYDVNGNITGLQRTGLGAGVMDQLGYTYDQSGNSNKLIRVNDASGNAAGYPVGGNTIGYDINGNMVNHLDKGISNIAYNYLNLPSSITASMGNTDYVYRADGTKVRKVFGGKTTDYLDGFQYENGVLQFVPTSEGYYDVVKNKYIYNYTDHLGNVRLSYTKGASGGAEIIEENNYYPFGLKHQGYNSSSLANNTYQYKYNGKELQETGMYDYGARMYMPELGRWGVVDPLAEKMTRHSPYNYAFDNPIRFIEADGREPLDWIQQSLNGRVSITFDPNVKSTSEAISAGYKNVTDVYSSATISRESSSTSDSYSYSLNTNGSVTSQDGKVMGGSFTTDAGTNISTGSYIGQWDGDKGFRGNWGSSDNFLAKLSYNFANNTYLALQTIDTFNLLEGKEVSGVTGNQVYSNLDGSHQFNAGDRAMAFSSTFNPIAAELKFLGAGKQVLPKAAFRLTEDLAPLNASQFSSLFKGTAISRAAPATRGMFNRYLNKGLNTINNINLFRSGYTGTVKSFSPNNKEKK